MTRLSLIAILTVCMSMPAGTLMAQDADNMNTGGTLRGEIFDVTAQRNPIVDVTVEIVGSDGKKFTVKTDDTGTFERSGLPAGRYLINVSKEGYNGRIGRRVTVIDGGMHYVQIKMTEEDNLITFLLSNKAGKFFLPFVLGFAAGFVVALILLSLRGRA